MTREEARNFLKSCAKSMVEISLTKSTFGELSYALEVIPDPETGLVNCGCGGKAIQVPSDGKAPNSTKWRVVCTRCGTSTVTGDVELSFKDATACFNRAMGYKEEE